VSDNIRGQLQATLGSAYTLERELGGGGMSRVFVAEETALHRKVVVKVLPRELAAGVNIERFNREIRLAANLQHSHIVPVLAAGETDGLPYYTMPFVEGESLAGRLARTGAQSIPDTIGILRDVAKALAYAHERGIVHRDIKPDNVLLSGGSATVTDFGIAKAISVSRTLVANRLTMTGTSIGTPVYMAPEQAAADPNVDHRADLYSFGCMAYELLSGRPPFVGRTAQQLLAAHMSEKPESIGTLRGDTPSELAGLIMQCLEKEPSDRPLRADALVRVLESVSSGDAQPAILLGGKGVFKRALIVYAVAFLGVTILAKAAIVGIGLPDWVFPGALIVMALGLPVILWTAYVHRVTRRTHSLRQGTMAALAVKAGPHMSWARTVRGGVFALSGFAVIVGAYMAMRALGIGPVGSLLAAGKMTEREPILLTDFTVTNGDSALGRVVSEAIRAGLSQSSVISLVPITTVADALRRMQRPPNARVDSALAGQLAMREGIRLIVDGKLTPLGAGYVVSVRLAAADSTANELALYRATADGLNDLIGAIDKIARKLRGRIGESLKSVQAAPALAHVTTGSLDALRKYSEGARAAIVERNRPKSIVLLRQAVAADTAFASAWRMLASQMANARMGRSHVDSAITRAYLLRDRLPPAEQGRVIAYYFSNGPGRDRAKAVATYEAMLAGGDSVARNNVALAYRSRREFARAESLHRVDLASPIQAVSFNLIRVLRDQGKLDAADSILSLQRAQFPQSTAPLRDAMLQLLFRGELDAAQRALDSARKVHDAFDPSENARVSAALALLRGRVVEWRRLHREARGIDSVDGLLQTGALADAVIHAFVATLVLGKPSGAVALLDSVSAQFPLRALPEVDRPYLAVARAYANAGAIARAQAITAQYRNEVLDTALKRQDEPAIHRVLGEIALADRRYDVARDEFRKGDRAPDGPANGCTSCLLFDLARTFDAAGMRDSAIAAYERYVTTPYSLRFGESNDPLFLPRALERLGQLYGSRGDAVKASSYFRRFVELWKNADPELQPRVIEARRRIAAQGG
jgi:tetratricopeptide (TPR) repeat protein